MGLWELFMKGGWLMWPLLILGGVTVFIFVERYMAIRKASGFYLQRSFCSSLQHTAYDDLWPLLWTVSGRNAPDWLSSRLSI